MIKFVSKSAKETIGLGKTVGGLLKPGYIIGLYGGLGSGKTTLTKGIAGSLKVAAAEVNSPSFVLIKEYKSRIPLFHFDLYRLENSEQINNLGLEDYFSGEGICVIEWAERLGELMPKEHIEIKLSHKKENSRSISIVSKGKQYQAFISRLKDKLG